MEVARALAEAGRERLGCDHCLSVTGIAGPGGAVAASEGRAAKPVGLVYVAHASAKAGTSVRTFKMSGDRASVRDWSAKCALMMLWLSLTHADAGSVRLLREVR